MVLLSRSSPAIHQCAIFLPQRKIKKEAGLRGNCMSRAQYGAKAFSVPIALERGSSFLF
jgi:hypothetical protein